MILIFGGAYQGKYEFVKSKFNIRDCDTYFCSEDKSSIDFSKKAIINLELFIKNILKQGQKPIEIINKNLFKFSDKIVICEDVCCGIVPISYEDRLFREAVGKILQILSRSSDEVYRVFCGIGERLK